VKAEGEEGGLDKIKKQLIKILKSSLKKSFQMNMDESTLIKGRNYSVGTIREWSGKKFKKVSPGKWLRMYETEKDKGLSQAVAKTIKKIENAKTVGELAQIISSNKKRFEVDGKMNPLVKDLLEKAKGQKGGLEAKKEKSDVSVKEKKETDEPSGIDKNLKRLKDSGYDQIMDINGKKFLYNPSKNEKYPVTAKDYKKYKSNLEKYFKDTDKEISDKKAKLKREKEFQDKLSRQAKGDYSEVKDAKTRKKENKFLNIIKKDMNNLDKLKNKILPELKEAVRIAEEKKSDFRYSGMKEQAIGAINEVNKRIKKLEEKEPKETTSKEKKERRKAVTSFPKELDPFVKLAKESSSPEETLEKIREVQASPEAAKKFRDLYSSAKNSLSAIKMFFGDVKKLKESAKEEKKPKLSAGEKRQLKFEEKLEKIAGVKKTKSGIYDYEIDSPYGKWGISVYGEDKKSPWIATRFYDTKNLPAGANPHSGKYNYHGSPAVEKFFSDLERMVKK
jgi:hypothetical protein